MTAFPKPSHTARKVTEARRRQSRKYAEDKAKGLVRRRDKHRCRFPLCGCGTLGLRLEVSHIKHKGHGGNPAGDRSVPEEMILLCVHRHQHGAVSRHHGTLRTRYLTAAKAKGPIAWDVKLPGRSRWWEVARESAVQVLEPPTDEQREVLLWLSSMNL